MAAFGVDGTAVIRATNEYLNDIAASDKAKATALAGFINNVDYMLVCSLPYETRPSCLPIRWIYGAGGQYFDSGIKPDVNCTTSLQFKVKTKNNTYPYIFGADSTDRWAAWLDGSQMGLRIGNSSSSRPTISVPNSLGKPYILNIRDGVIKLNGEQKATYARTNLINYSIFIFGTSTQGNPTGNGAPMDGYISFTQINEHYFVPILKEGSEQMIDLATGNYATKHGTFSIVYTTNDGVTPWTPPTP
jgi:hypothetical protein